MRKLFGFAALLLLGGCSSLHHTSPYRQASIEAINPGQAGGAGLPTQQQFVIPDGPITLEKAVEIALVNNPAIAAGQWDSSAASARREQMQGQRLPNLGLVGGYNHSLDRQRLISASQDGESGLFTRDTMAGDIVLSIPLFTGGQLINQIRAAELLEKAASHRLSYTREEIIFNVSSLFHAILAQNKVIDSLAFSHRALSEHLKRINALMRAEKAATVDRMRTEVRLADIDQRLVQGKNLLSIQYRSLANLLGWNVQTESFTLDGKLEPELITDLPGLESALTTAMQNRADYLAAAAAIEAKVHSVDAASADHMPHLALQGSYGRRWAVGSTEGSGDEQGDVGRLGLVMEVPLYDGGRINAGVMEQRAELAAAKERLRSLTLQIRLDVETAFLNIESSKKRATAIEKSIVQAKESLRIEQQKYDLGKGAIVDVLDAQNALLDTETTYYRMLAEFYTARAQLKFAMGE